MKFLALMSILALVDSNPMQKADSEEYQGSVWSYVDACNCQCSQSPNSDAPACTKRIGERRWCTVDDEVAPFCRHIQFDDASKRYRSLDACYTPTLFQPPCSYLPTTCEVHKVIDDSLVTRCFFPAVEQVGLKEDCDSLLPQGINDPLKPCKCFNITLDGNLSDPDELLSCASSRNSASISTFVEAKDAEVIVDNKVSNGCLWTLNEDIWKCA